VEEASKKFEDMGKYINTYVDYVTRKSSKAPPDMPIKAKFPIDGHFRLQARVHKISNGSTKDIFYVHEIVDDNSSIGFEKLQILLESNISSIDLDKLENFPTVSKEIPGITTEVLKTEGASKKKLHATHRTKRKSCSSLKNVEITEDSISGEDIARLLKIYKENMQDEVVDQSLTESSKSIEKKIRKTRVSSEYEKKEQEKKEYTHNFDEFQQYMTFLRTRDEIKNLSINNNQEMRRIIDPVSDRLHPKCSISGRLRQYISATFEYNGIYVGLLELENPPGKAASTWVISSREPVNTDIFNHFLLLYVEHDKAINQIKRMYRGANVIKFATKNHERANELSNEDLIRWIVGILGKLLKL
jgi:hypothetical protein